MPGRRTFIIGGGCTAFIKVGLWTPDLHHSFGSSFCSPGRLGPRKTYERLLFMDATALITFQMGLEAATKALLDAGKTPHD